MLMIFSLLVDLTSCSIQSGYLKEIRAQDARTVADPYVASVSDCFEDTLE